jgi:hypothetical protein
MASDGDTITYAATSSDSPTTEDISTIEEITIDYLDGAGGKGSSFTGGSGGRVQDVTVDTSAYNTLYLWIPVGADSDAQSGRYYGETGVSFSGAASAEIALVNTDRADSGNEQFLAAAGGGGGAGSLSISGHDGARGGSAEGTAPPQGGAGGAAGGAGGDGEGAIDNLNRSIVSGGTTTTGGGAGEDTGGGAQVSYTSLTPVAPSGLTASLTTADDVSLSWTDNSTTEDEFRVYRTSVGTPSFPADYSQIAAVGQNVTSYTDVSPPADSSLTYAVTAANSYGESSETSAAITTPVLGTVEWTPATGAASIEEPAAGGADIEEPAAGEADIEQPASGEADIQEPAAGEADIEQPASGEADIQEPAPGDIDDSD